MNGLALTPVLESFTSCSADWLMTISHKLAWTKEAWEPCTSTLPLITPYTDPVQEHSTPSTHLHISVISKSREKFKPDHHRHLTEHKHILTGLTDSGPPHYWSYAGQVFHSLVNHTVHLHGSTQHARAASHLPLVTPGSTLQQASLKH